jgi:predicted sugar kinase
MTTISLAAPASLALAAVRGGPEGAGAALLGVTLQHPPIGMLARPSPQPLITGARANLANAVAATFLAHHGLFPRAEIEIEQAIPRAMGLGSDPMLALSIARTLAAAHGLPGDTAALAGALGLTAPQGLAAHGFAGGGLLLVEAAEGSGLPRLLRRAEIAHREEQAWVFVFLLPRTPPDLDAEFEERQLAALHAAASVVSPESGTLVEHTLWPALASDDLEAFGAGLARLHALTLEAMAAQGFAQPLGAKEQATLATMQRHGAVACGRALGGLGLYGLLRGAAASRALRRELISAEVQGGGTVLATIVDNRGAHLK